jgi:hypothetical protein
MPTYRDADMLTQRDAEHNAELGALAHLTAQTDLPNQPLQREPRPVPSGHQSKPRAIPITHSDQ